MILREKPGHRKSWALARFRTKGEALSCVQAGVVDPTSFTPTGLVLPAMETNGEGDVQLVVRWSSEASVAKNILSNQDGALADMWLELQSRADDLSATKDKAAFSPYEQTALIKGLVRAAERIISARELESGKSGLVEQVEKVDELLGGVEQRALEQHLGDLVDEARYLMLHSTTDGERARARFKKLAATVLGSRRAARFHRGAAESKDEPQGAQMQRRSRAMTFGHRHYVDGRKAEEKPVYDLSLSR